MRTQLLTVPCEGGIESENADLIKLDGSNSDCAICEVTKNV